MTNIRKINREQQITHKDLMWFTNNALATSTCREISKSINMWGE